MKSLIQSYPKTKYPILQSSESMSLTLKIFSMSHLAISCKFELDSEDLQLVFGFTAFFGYNISKVKIVHQNLWTVKMDEPCYEMPYIDYKHSHADSANAGTDGHVLFFSYPQKAKFVTNFRDVDVHSLLGNVGGYIGLFLGKYHLIS